MTEQNWKTLWSILICAAILALIALVAIQQSWVKHRPIGLPHQRPNEQ